ncbi:hypothetical protein ANRL2_01706 [Anaerolineae bacterium]|nr:hypothetical protein ANRL2_01706 [Anaerolineae bacterium]
MKSISHRFTRQQLYDLVWQSPITSVAKTLGISDVGVAKACKKANIPVPPRGYWARSQASKRVSRTQLERRGFGNSDEVCFGNAYGSYDRGWDTDLPPPPTYDETLTELINRAQATVKRISHPKTLANPHHLIDAALKEDENRHAKLLEAPYYWRKPLFEAPEAKRKLRILNAIFTVMTKVGEKPFLKCNDQTISAGTKVGEMHASIEFETIIQKNRPETAKKRSAAKPCLRLTITHYDSNPGFQTSWADSDESTLEDQVEQIAAGLLVAGEMNYRRQAQHSYDWLIERKAAHEEQKRKEQERKERERLEQIRKLERQRRRQLLCDALSWRRADEIRAFVAAVNARTNQAPTAESKERLHRWTEWALAEADQMDPMKREISELIDYM